jgi:hypothetical protein
MSPQVPGLFYSSKLQAALTWWKQPLNFASKKVVRYIGHGVKVEFKMGLPFAPKPSVPKFVDPQDVDFAIQDLLKGKVKFRDLHVLHTRVCHTPSSDAQVGRQTTRLHVKSGCGECVLSRTHSSEAPQVLLQPLSATALCQQQVHRASSLTRSCRSVGPARQKSEQVSCQ